MSISDVLRLRYLSRGNMSLTVTPNEATDGTGVGKSCETLTRSSVLSSVTFSAAFGLKSTAVTQFSSH